MQRNEPKSRKSNRERVLSVRVSEEEFYRLKAHALSQRAPASSLIRDRIADLITG